MAKTGLNWTNSIYPARYFVGYIIVKDGVSDRRFDCENAPMLPLNPRRAIFFPNSFRSPFYGRSRSHVDGVIKEIQYAISSWDEKNQIYGVQKFNHRFRRAVIMMLRDGGYILEPAAPATKLFAEYKLNALSEQFSSPMPCVQFIA